MPLSLERTVSTDRASVRQARTLAPLEDQPQTSQAAASDWHVIPLDQLNVVEGVYRKAQLTSANELVPGDEIMFPVLDAQSRANLLSNTDSNPIDVSTANCFGPTSFSAAITHSVIFLSVTGHQLTGYVLDSSPNADGRVSLLLCGMPRPKLDYAFIDISEHHGRSDGFDAVVTEATQLPPQDPTGPQSEGCAA